MKIIAQNLINTVNLNTNKEKKTVNKNYYETQNSNNYFVQPNVLPIYFTGNIKLADEKILVQKLTKLVDDLLATKNPEESISDMITNSLRKAVGVIKYKMKNAQRLNNEFIALTQNKIINNQQKINRAVEIKKELEKLRKIKLIDNPDKKTNLKNISEENLDYMLLNKFKSAIMAEDYRLDKIYKNYYLPLNEIKKTEELKDKFPKIPIIKNPVEVISKKIADNITRDFYENLDVVIREKGFKGAVEYLKTFFESLYTSYSKLIDEDTFYNKISESLVHSVLAKYETCAQSGSIASIPQFRKNPIANLTKEDLELLKLDYDDFVTFVTRQIYVEGKKLSDIVYKSGDIEISVGKINDTNYKFKKPVEKIKRIVNDAKEIENSRRAYEYFDVKKLQDRLNYYANTEVAMNDTVLETLIHFNSCKFEKEDVEQLIKLLKELDKCKDGQIKLEEVAEKIIKEEIKPRGTQKLDKIEVEKLEQEIKSKQKDASKLAYIQENFDNTMNILYMNNMNGLVDICSKYRPMNLNGNPESDFVIDLLSKHIVDNKIKDKNILEMKLLRWDTYKTYSELEPENPIFKKALEYAKGDEVKAGQYILNAEIVGSFPQLPNDYAYAEVLEKLYERISESNNVGAKQNLITLYMCKLDDCMSMPIKERRLVSNLLEKFELNDDIDKILLKYVFENDYIVNATKININNSNRIAVFAPSAKQAIHDTYKYPNSLLVIRQFEEAMTNSTGPKGTAGIKPLGNNNSQLKGYFEVKIMGNSGDRLEMSSVSDSEEIVFDIFKAKGRH